MEKVCQELDEVKAEFEKLKDEYRNKTDLSRSLKQAHDDQLLKFREAKLLIERQAHELNAKSEENAEVRQLYEETKAKLQDKESSLRQASSANEKLRTELGEKIHKLEAEKGKLVSALDEATVRGDDLEKKLGTCNEEMEGLRRLLGDAQKKCLEAEEKARSAKEIRHRDDVIMSLEKKSGNIQEELKWKKEQFDHLEEAHRKLRDEFRLSKEQWASEKLALLDEISSLNTSLDSQVRMNESLQAQLKMCNQALAHEESKRKTLEVQLSESKQCFNNLLGECQEAKSKIESLSRERDEEIASLRNSLGTKQAVFKEMEYKVAHLEQENKELLQSVKELQESQISRRKQDPTVTKLRNRLKNLEQVHENCSVILSEREAEWNSKMEKLIQNINIYESDIKSQTAHICQLQKELESCHSSMEATGEEISILFVVLKSKFSEACLKLPNSEAQMEGCEETRVENVKLPAEQLGLEDSSPMETQICLKQAREQIALLSEKLESFKLLEEQSCSLEKELAVYKKMLEESSKRELQLKEHVMMLEASIEDVTEALDNSNSELNEKIREASQRERECQIWKSQAKDMRTCLEQSQEICCKIEASLLAEGEIRQILRKENENLLLGIEEREQKMSDLQQQNVLLDEKLEETEQSTKSMKMQVAAAHEKEEQYIQIIRERDAVVEELEKKVSRLDQESINKECIAADCARAEAEKTYKQEISELSAIVKEKDQSIKELQMLSTSLEQTYEDAVTSCFSEVLQKLVESNELRGALEEAERLKSLKVREDKLLVDELKKEITNLSSKLVNKEEAERHKSLKVQEEKLLVDELNKEIADLSNKLVIKEEAERLKSLEVQEEKLLVAELRKEITNLSNKLAIKVEAERCKSLEVQEEKLLVDELKKEIADLSNKLVIKEEAECLKGLQVQEEKLLVDELKKQIIDLRNKLVIQEESLLRAEQAARHIEASLRNKNLEMENLKVKFEDENTSMKRLIKELESAKEASVEDIKKLSMEKDYLAAYIQEVSIQIEAFYGEDVKLLGMLGNMVHCSEQHNEIASETMISNKIHGLAENDFSNLLMTKELGMSIDERSPLRELN